MTAMYMWIFFFTIFKDYVTGLEVLARLLYYLFQGHVVVSSHSSFIHYIEVELVLGIRQVHSKEHLCIILIVRNSLYLKKYFIYNELT